MKRYDKHIFICENRREPGDPRGCCAEKGGAEIKKKFKTRLKELGLSSIIRANTAGCLDACEFGATVLIYPEQIWYGGVTPDDVEEIIQSHLLNGEPVKRLMMTDKKFYKDEG